jgi:cysteine-rich secretory family protein
MASLPDLPQTEIAIVEMTNAFRRESRLGALAPNRALTLAARAFADYLAKSGKFAHEADGREPAQRAEAQGYRYCLVAENLALNLDSRGFETRQLARDVVEGWKTSPGHRANMLLPHATEIGVAIVRAPDKNPKFVSVQLLGRPESLKVEFSIANRSGATITYRLGEKEATLSANTVVTHTRCDPEAVTFTPMSPAARSYEPRDGDRFVIRNERGIPKVEIERK